jgi:4-cresol dehydrogenase (hydroxylating)
MNDILPPGVSAERMAQALELFRKAVGKDWVFTGEAAESYHDPYPITNDPGRFKAHGAVAPGTTEQVQEIVRIAAEHSVPLWPVSRGKNFAYGGAAPVLSGSVVVDLSRMNRILEVNEQFGYALVEPGVSYFQLYDYIQEKGLKLWLDVPDPQVPSSTDAMSGKTYGRARRPACSSQPLTRAA